MTFHTRRWQAPLLALAGLTCAAWPAAAQSPAAPGIVLEVTPAFDGWYREGRWIALFVELRNAGEGAPVEVVVEPVGARATVVVPVDLPAGAVKRIPVLVRPETGDVRVAVVRGAGRLAERRVSLRPLQGDGLVAVVADGEVDLDEVEGLTGKRPTTQVRVRPEDLPENSLAFASLDDVVLAGADLGRVSEAQIEALRQWVALGGQLVTLGGPAAGGLGALPEALRPATAGGTRRLAQSPSSPGQPAKGGPVGSTASATTAPSP